MKRQFSLLLSLLIVLALSACGAARQPSRLPNPDEVEALLVQLVDVEKRAPGSTYEYSNYGMGLLGNLLVRQASQADYEALLLESITGPLGMESTRIEVTPDMRSRLAAPHKMSHLFVGIGLHRFSREAF